MTDPTAPETPDPETAAPRPDRDTPGDAERRLRALEGSDAGSDTRAGSLAGGAATGSEHDPAQDASNRHLAALGRRQGRKPDTADAPPLEGVVNTGHPREQARNPGDDADAATG